MKVIIASTSAIKVHAIQTFFPKANITCIDVETSFIQPWGKVEALTCLSQRITQCIPFATSDDTIIFAIENFIFTEDGRFYDSVGIAVYRSRDIGQHFFIFDEKEFRVRVPDGIYQHIWDLQALGQLQTTVGDILMSSDIKYKSKDWFKAAGSDFDRQEQIELGIRKVISNLFETRQWIRLHEEWK